eukprot:sb/3470934/
MNPVLWDKSKRKLVKKTGEVLDRLSRKLNLPVYEITAQWNVLSDRYSAEKFLPKSDWKYRIQLDFLEEESMLACPDDVSPLFSLLNNSHNDDNENEPSSTINEGDQEGEDEGAGDVTLTEEDESPLFGLMATAVGDDDGGDNTVSTTYTSPVKETYTSPVKESPKPTSPVKEKQTYQKPVKIPSVIVRLRDPVF